MPLTGRPLEAPVHIPRLLRAGLGQAPDDMALVSTATHCTWRDLDRASDNLAGNLLGMGLSPGDRVASLMPNRTALIIHYIACMKSGLVGVPLNYRYTVSEIDRALEVSEASVLLAHGERERELAGPPWYASSHAASSFTRPKKSAARGSRISSQRCRRRMSFPSPERAILPSSSSPRAARGRPRG
jgi:acyl-coenzyme A synthetase/AMP-(fatty) acid ligase